jgi:hypothetical protein
LRRKKVDAGANRMLSGTAGFFSRYSIRAETPGVKMRSKRFDADFTHGRQRRSIIKVNNTALATDLWPVLMVHGVCMGREGTHLQIYLVLLPAFLTAVASTPIVREKMANRHPRALPDVMNEVSDSLAMQAAATTD